MSPERSHDDSESKTVGFKEQLSKIRNQRTDKPQKQSPGSGETKGITNQKFRHKKLMPLLILIDQPQADWEEAVPSQEASWFLTQVTTQNDLTAIDQKCRSTESVVGL